MTTETKVNHIVSNAKVDVLSEILRDTTTLIKNVQIPLSDVGKWSVDVEYDDEHYVEVSCKFIKKL